MKAITGTILVALMAAALMPGYLSANDRTREAEEILKRMDEDSLRKLEPPEPWDPREYMRQQQKEAEEDGGFDVGPLLIMVLLVGVVIGGSFWIFRWQAREMNLPRTEQELAGAAATRGSALGVSPKEAVFAAAAKTGAWVRPGRVATASKLSSTEAEVLLRELVDEGRMEIGRDKEGRPVFRVAG